MDEQTRSTLDFQASGSILVAELWRAWLQNETKDFPRDMPFGDVYSRVS